MNAKLRSHFMAMYVAIDPPIDSPWMPILPRTKLLFTYWQTYSPSFWMFQILSSLQPCLLLPQPRQFQITRLMPRLVQYSSHSLCMVKSSYTEAFGLQKIMVGMFGFSSMFSNQGSLGKGEFCRERIEDLPRSSQEMVLCVYICEEPDPGKIMQSILAPSNELTQNCLALYFS